MLLQPVAHASTFLVPAVVVSVAACDQWNQPEQLTTPNRGLPDAAARTDAHAAAPVTFRNDATRVRPAPGTVTDIDAGLCIQLPDGGWGASACAECPPDAIPDAGCDGRISKCDYFYGCRITCACAHATWSCRAGITAGCPE